jgi:glycosyltransferase involved in cell wall biosynthesis
MPVLEQVEKGKSQKGLFSIVVPVLNNAGQLQRCIDSFVQQSEKNKELIIVDGGSTDGTLEIINRNKDFISRSVSEKDNGIYAAFNRGIRLSQGEWLLFLGSDDFLWGNDVLLNVTQILEKNWSGQKVVYGQVVVFDDKQKVIDVRGEPWSAFQQKPIGKWDFDHQGIFHHRSIFEEHGLFDESFYLCGDHELLLRELKANDALFLDGIVVTGKSSRGVSSLPRNLKCMIREKEKIFLLNNILNERAASRWLICKMAIYESLREWCGVEFADRMFRVVKWVRGR